MGNKSNYCNKLITKLKVGDNVITDPIQILDEGHNFYRNLHLKNAGHNLIRLSEIGTTFTNAGSLPKIDVMQQEHCECLMNKNDLLKTLKAFKNGKTPGMDGINAEFYHFFGISSSQYQLFT